MKDFIQTLRPALVSILVFTGLLGIVYPLLVGGISKVAFSNAATGSVIYSASGQAVGSDLIGQPFDNPGYFWSRPSAIGYNAMTSSGVNAGPSAYGPGGVLGPNAALVDAVAGRIKALRDADPGNMAKVPVDLVTASSSGLDPHLSPAGVLYQVGRVARARGVDEQKVRSLVERSIEPRTLGILGEPRVNLVRLNLALDSELAAKQP
jgi:K+-transporting ATPase ATPase C chain